MTFVELCAGSAAVSLRWLRAGAKPPLSYQGGKRGYADAIPRGSCRFLEVPSDLRAYCDFAYL